MDIEELDALLASAKRAETTVPLCLRGDLQAEWEDLERQLSEARTQSARKLATPSAGVDLASKMADLEARMRDSIVPFRFQARPRREWKKLETGHPPRKDNDTDKTLGVNVDTLFDVAIPACLIEPELDAERLATLLDTLTSAQYEKIVLAVWRLNRQDVDVPFSPIASRIMTNSVETSRQQPESAPASGDS